MLFALMPAIQASHVDLSGALKSEGSGVVGGSGRSRLRSALVLVQVSLSFVLLAGTGLLLQSLQRMQNASPGFSTDNVIVSVVDLVFCRLQTRSRENFSHAVARPRSRTSRRRIGSIGAGHAIQLRRLLHPRRSRSMAISRRPMSNRTRTIIEVSEDYFATLGIPIVVRPRIYSKR